MAVWVTGYFYLKSATVTFNKMNSQLFKYRMEKDRVCDQINAVF